MSTLETVVGSNQQQIAEWNSCKADVDSPLTLFHTKFWGVEEEGVSTVSDNMDVDDSTADGHDISPHSYVLDIGIRGVETEIWVRADYIRIFKFAEKFYAESLSNSKSLSPCLVITGQPGIGKTLWRWYALRMCCAQRKPVILYRAGSCWLLVDEGVFRQPTNFQSDYYKTVIWTLVDAADSPSSPPIGLTTHGAQHFVLYITSPTPSRWNKIHQSMRRTVCVMNPWTKAEIQKAAPFLAPDRPLPDIEEIFDRLGPTPRLCFGDERSLFDHKEGLDKALAGLSLDYLEKLASRINDLELDAVSHTIIVLRRSTTDVEPLNSKVYIELASHFIASEVARWMRALKCHELVSLFNRYNALPVTRKMSGDIFEAYCHVIFSMRIKFDFVSMVRIGEHPTVRERRMPQWHSSHTEFSGSAQSQALEVLRAGASRASLNMYPSRVVDYDSTEIARGLHIEANVYYIPIKTSQPGIDSFILHDKTLYFFQMTVSDTHSISDKFYPFLNSLKGLPPNSNWRFIFVKPPGKILICPVPTSAELLGLDLYSAEVEVTGEVEVTEVTSTHRTKRQRRESEGPHKKGKQKMETPGDELGGSTQGTKEGLHKKGKWKMETSLDEPGGSSHLTQGTKERLRKKGKQR